MGITGSRIIILSKPLRDSMAVWSRKILAVHETQYRLHAVTYEVLKKFSH